MFLLKTDSGGKLPAIENPNKGPCITQESYRYQGGAAACAEDAMACWH
jgi:hypothetical protein